MRRIASSNLPGHDERRANRTSFGGVDYSMMHKCLSVSVLPVNFLAQCTPFPSPCTAGQKFMDVKLKVAAIRQQADALERQRWVAIICRHRTPSTGGS